MPPTHQIVRRRDEYKDCIAIQWAKDAVLGEQAFRRATEVTNRLITGRVSQMPASMNR